MKKSNTLSYVLMFLVGYGAGSLIIDILESIF